jgi:hypothetical protein
MNDVIIRHALCQDPDECFTVETSGFPPKEATTRETIRLCMVGQSHAISLRQLWADYLAVRNPARRWLPSQKGLFSE